MSEKKEKAKPSISSPSSVWTDNFLMRPLTNTPGQMASSVANKIDAPRMGSTIFNPNSMMGRAENTGNILNAMIRGGLAGATEGVGNLINDSTSPMGIISALTGAKGVQSALKGTSGITKAISPTIDVVENIPVRQIAPSADDVTALIGDMQRNLAKLPKKKPMIDNSGKLPAEMIAPGMEAGYNASRPMSNIMANMNPPMMRPRLPNLQLPQGR